MTNPTDRDELKPCPFCGGKADWAWHSGSALWIECSACGAIGPQDEDTTDANHAKTLAAWNRRPTPQAGDALTASGNDVLREALEEAKRRASLIAIVDQGCGGTLSFKEMADSAMLQGRELAEFIDTALSTTPTMSAEESRTPPHDTLLQLLRGLADAEKGYRLTHDTNGAGSRLTGRAWDLMRRAGDKAREYLAALSNEGTEG